MKVIFLDIDGVLNSESDFIYHSGPKKGQPKDRGPHTGGWWCDFEKIRGIDNKKVKRLAKIVQETGAIIVLVSSWKHYYERFLKTKRDTYGRYLYNKLKREGLTIHSTTYKEEKIKDVYGHYERYVRGNGILHWLRKHEGEVESWIALDDEAWDYFGTQLDHIVRTIDEQLPYGGLLDCHVEEAIKKLNNIDK